MSGISGGPMQARITVLSGLLLLWLSHPALAQDPHALVSKVIQTELDADKTDHSRWLYYDVDNKPEGSVHKWVAETNGASLNRVLFRNGQPTTAATQRNSLESFIHDPSAQAKQRKSGQHDDKESEDLLRLLPDAFKWSVVSSSNGTTRLHFVPNPSFSPPTWSARVFAAMEGDMQVNDAQHRIISLKGRIIHEVKFCGGLCGSISPGGTFNVQRREIGPSIWQITETHVHIHGVILFFKSISEQEDETKTEFRQLPGNLSLEQAESLLMQQNPNPTTRPQSAHVSIPPQPARPH